jgi:hypothetical protein
MKDKMNDNSNFKRWLETDNEIEWHRLFDHLLRMYSNSSIWNDPQFHPNMIRLLRNVGLDEEANHLEMIRPSQQDIETGNTPLSSLKNKDQRSSFSTAYHAYSTALEDVGDKIYQKAKAMNWQWVN